MRKIIQLSAVIVAMVLAIPSFARADEDVFAFYRQPAQGALNVAGTPGRPLGAHSGPAAIIAAHFAAAGMSSWTPTMLRIARIESGLKCSPGGNGGGMLQFTRGTRRSLGLHNPRDCNANAAAGVRYAQRCIALGARTAAGLMRCWNGGSPTARRLERAYRIALRG